MDAILGFFSAHGVALAALAVAVMDFIIEMVPSLKANSLISLLLGLLKKKAEPPVV